MKDIFAHKHLAIVIIIIVASVFILSKCVQSKQEEKKIIKNLKGQEYAGTESCRNCHQAIYDSFSATRHHHESEPASDENIKGSFSKNQNILYLDSRPEGDHGKKGRQSIPGGLYKRERGKSRTI
jgi:hypothetical protein